LQPTAVRTAHPINALSKNNLQVFNRGKIMRRLAKFSAIIALFSIVIFLINCGGVSTGASGTAGTTSASTGSGGSGSGSGGSGQTVPGYGEGTGASGQTSAARFLYANPLPGGGPFASSIQSNGVLTATHGGSANNLDPETLAIDPSGSFIYQTAVGGAGSQGGIFGYAINRADGSLGNAVGSYLTDQAVYADVVDNQGKFLYALGTAGVYAFTIQSGALTPVSGSPFAAAGASSASFPQPATLMSVDQTNQFLYVSTSGGISGYAIDQNSGALTPIAGSPFGTDVSKGWAIVITPNNSYLYELQSQDEKNIFAYSIDQATGVLSPISGSPFPAGTCGTMVTPGTIGIPGPDNMTIASAGKFMYDNCGIYSLSASTGAITQVSGSGPGDWPVIDPTGNFLWALTGDQEACFSCDIGVTTYSVDPNTGALTPVPNSFLLLTNTEVGSVDSLAITK
jgi:6-phosphogluconolactonase (cycloisomerase 2 family)